MRTMVMLRKKALIRNILYRHEIILWNRNILYKPPLEFNRRWQGFNLASSRFHQQKSFTGTSNNGWRNGREKEEKKDDKTNNNNNGRNQTQNNRSRNLASWRGNKIQTKTDGKKMNKHSGSKSPKMRKGESYNNKGFISLFDEVDLRMGKSLPQNGFIRELDEEMEKKNSPETDNQSLASFFKSLDDDPKSLSSGLKNNKTSSQDSDPLPFISAYLSSIEKNKGDENSMFDGFLRHDVKTRDPDAFDEETFDQYREMIDEITKQKRFSKDHTNKPISQDNIKPVVDWLLKEKTIVKYELPTLLSAIEQGIATPLSFTKGETSHIMDDTNQNVSGSSDNIETAFRKELHMQKDRFLKTTKLSPEQYNLALRVLKLLSDRCAKQLKSAPIDIAWEKIKEAGMIPNEHIMSTYLYIVSTSSGSSLSLSSFMNSKGQKGMSSLFSDPSSVRESDPTMSDIFSSANLDDTGNDDQIESENIIDVPQEVAVFHDMLYHPTEKSISLRVKGFVAKGDAKMAQEILDAFPVSMIFLQQNLDQSWHLYY